MAEFDELMKRAAASGDYVPVHRYMDAAAARSDAEALGVYNAIVSSGVKNPQLMGSALVGRGELHMKQGNPVAAQTDYRSAFADYRQSSAVSGNDGFASQYRKINDAANDKLGVQKSIGQIARDAVSDTDVLDWGASLGVGAGLRVGGAVLGRVGARIMANEAAALAGKGLSGGTKHVLHRFMQGFIVADNAPEIIHQAKEHGALSKQVGAEVMTTAAEVAVVGSAAKAGSFLAGGVRKILGGTAGLMGRGAEFLDRARAALAVPAVLGGAAAALAAKAVAGAASFGAKAAAVLTDNMLTRGATRVAGYLGGGFAGAMVTRAAMGEWVNDAGVRPPLLQDSLSGHAIDAAFGKGVSFDQADANKMGINFNDWDALVAKKGTNITSLDALVKRYNESPMKFTVSNAHEDWRKLTGTADKEDGTVVSLVKGGEGAGLIFGEKFTENKFLQIYPAIKDDLRSNDPARQARAMRNVIDASLKAHDTDAKEAGLNLVGADKPAAPAAAAPAPKSAPSSAPPLAPPPVKIPPASNGVPKKYTLLEGVPTKPSAPPAAAPATITRDPSAATPPKSAAAPKPITPPNQKTGAKP